MRVLITGGCGFIGRAFAAHLFAVKRVGDTMGLDVAIKSIPNPRKELEEHYYNPTHSGLKDLGLKPHYMTDDVIAAMLERIIDNKDRIVPDRIMPRVRWN